MSKILFAVIAVGLFSVMGCSKDSSSSSGGATTASGGGDAIGVQECDDYIKKMTACLEKLPGPAKAASEPAFKQMRDSWKQTAASGAAAKAALQTGCKAALDGLASNPACK